MNYGGIAVNQRDSNKIKFHWNGPIMFTPKPVPVLTKTQNVDTEHQNFRQEIIYNGRSLDILKFLYREISNDILRAPFSQDVQYDLKEGNTNG